MSNPSAPCGCEESQRLQAELEAAATKLGEALMRVERLRRALNASDAARDTTEARRIIARAIIEDSENRWK